MSDELSREELEAQAGSDLPDKEAMTLLDPALDQTARSSELVAELGPSGPTRRPGWR